MTDKILFLVTGTSAGFGAAILRQINNMYGERACIVACSRNTDKVSHITAGFSGAVKTASIEFSKRDGMKESCESAFDLYNGTEFSEVFLFNNHATLNDVSRTLAKFDDVDEMSDYFLINVISFQVLTGVFLNKFPGVKHTVVNISSLCAVKAFPSFGLYCTGKAARKMCYDVLAEEHPEVGVLSYSPGPMDTGMTHTIDTDSVSPATRALFAGLNSAGSWVDVDQSAAKMMNILRDGKYENGAHMDFYDR